MVAAGEVALEGWVEVVASDAGMGHAALPGEEEEQDLVLLVLPGLPLYLQRGHLDRGQWMGVLAVTIQIEEGHRFLQHEDYLLEIQVRGGGF